MSTVLAVALWALLAALAWGAPLGIVTPGPRPTVTPTPEPTPVGKVSQELLDVLHDNADVAADLIEKAVKLNELVLQKQRERQERTRESGRPEQQAPKIVIVVPPSTPGPTVQPIPEPTVTPRTGGLLDKVFR